MTQAPDKVTGRYARWLLIGPAAVAGLAAIVLGGPILLLALGGNPWPRRLLGVDELAELLTRPDDGQLLMWALSVVGWVAWAVVAGSILLELGAQLTGRRTPHVPGLAGPQRLAGMLVAGVLAALTTPGISQAHAAYLDTAPIEVQLGPPHAYGSPTGFQLGPPQAYGSPTGFQLGPPQAYGSVTETPTAFPGQPQRAVQPPPAERPEPEPGQQPEPEQEPEQDEEQLVHEVAKGDWMWHIAGRYLGDEERFPEIAELNPEYARRYVDYPDHIQPGDQLVLPDDARDRGERRHAAGELIGDDDPETENAETDDRAEAEPEPPPEPAPPPASEAPPETERPATPTPTPSPEPAPAPPPPPAASTPPQEAAPFPQPPGDQDADPPPADDPDDDPYDDPTIVGTGPLATAGVLASVLLGALLLFRWRKQARRRHRRIITATTEAHAETETGLRAAATADVARLDRALRVLAGTLSGDTPRLPDIGAVWIGDGEIHLILASPTDLDPPPPFHAAGPGSWFLPADAALPEPAGTMPFPDPAHPLAPLPTLVTIGSQPGQHLLVDLERMGMLTITGEAERTSDLLRYLVAELAHNPWSDRVEVILAGFPPEAAQALTVLNPDRLTVAASLPDAVSDLRRRLTHTTAALTSHGLADSVHGRTSDTAADTWTPHLLLVNRPRPEHDELLAELETALAEVGRRCAVAVATTAPPGVPYGRQAIAITDEGLLKAGFLHDSHPLPAVALPEHLLEPLADLMRDATDDTDHPIPPAAEPWAEGTDCTGGTLVLDLWQPATAGPALAAPGNGPAPANANANEHHPRHAASQPHPDDDGSNGHDITNHSRADLTDLTDTTEIVGTPIQLPVAAGPAVGGDLTVAPPAPIGIDDPGLDEAVTAWLEHDDRLPRIALLGPIRITAGGAPPPHRARVCRELIVYLAGCGEHGADATELARRLWPTQPVAPTVRTDVIANARRWLGTAPDGEPWLPEATPDGRYRLRAGILVDWHLFRRLRARGERRGLDGVDDLRTALQLVRGAPLADADQLAAASVRIPYSWLPGSVVQPELILAGIVDTAHQLVDLSLATGDLDTARWAVEQAWLADTHRSDDYPWRDLLRITHTYGDRDRVRAVVAELLRWRDAEHPDELTPATQRLINNLLLHQPTGLG